jgi:hypothetical protein
MLSHDRNIFECIGYMKNKLPGEGEFSMFINENSYGSTGGFQWTFQDFCPDAPHEYGRIFIHTMSYEEIKRKIIHELEFNKTL